MIFGYMMRGEDESTSHGPHVARSPESSSLLLGEMGLLRMFIQQEMHKLESSFANQVQMAKVDVLASFKQEAKQEIQKLDSAFANQIQIAKLDILANVRQEAAAIQTLKADLLSSFREEYKGVNLHKEQPDKSGSAMMSEANVASLAEKTIGDNNRAAPNDHWKCPVEENVGDASRAAPNNQYESTWFDLSRAVTDIDHRFRNDYFDQIRSHFESPSIWHTIAIYLGIEKFLHWKAPNNILVRIATHPAFAVMQNLLILLNTCFMTYEANASITEVLHEGSPIPNWVHDASKAFSWIFAAEVFFRMFAFRSWFWVARDDWTWNMFDLTVVLSSLATDHLFDGVNLTFVRTFRILRVIRAVRLVRVLRFFRELRKMLFAILSSIRSLVWCFLFLAMTIFMFTILFLQGLVEALQDMEPGTNTHARTIAHVRQYYDSVSVSMLSLLAAVTGGTDWMAVREPLTYAGRLYTTAYLVYVLFVIVGMMNVLTGVFLAGADEFMDRNTVVQNQQMKVARFVEQMLDIFAEIDENHVGEIDWQTFRKTMHDETVLAYLAAHEVEPTHARVIFDLLDEEGKGKVNAFDWTMGMVRMMGAAKAVDARIIQRQLTLLPNMLHDQFHRPFPKDRNQW